MKHGSRLRYDEDCFEMQKERKQRMKFEKLMPFECHPSCVYRKFVRGKGMKCINDDSEADMLTEGGIVCPVGRDYFEHMDVFYAILRTERGFVGLNVISGEPMMVEPAIMEYMEWLRTRRKSASLWKAPQNIEDMIEERMVTDVIYAEFILGRDASRMIRKLAKEAYPAFEKILPDDLRKLSEKTRKGRASYYAKVRNQEDTQDGRLAFAQDVLLMEHEIIDKAYWAWYRDRWITRTDFMKIRNYFRGWE